MNDVYERCAGLDVHKMIVFVCAFLPVASGQRHKEHQTFSTITPNLLRMRSWLTAGWGEPCDHGVNWRVLAIHLSCAGKAR
jgi:hypothetical protein